MINRINTQQSAPLNTSTHAPTVTPLMQKIVNTDHSSDVLVLSKQALLSTPFFTCIQDFCAAITKWFQSLISSGSSTAATTINLGDSSEGRQVLSHIDAKRLFIQDKLGDSLNHLFYSTFPKFVAVVVKVNGRIVETHHSVIDRSSQQAFCQSAVQKMEHALMRQNNLSSLLQGERASINIMLVTGTVGNNRPYFYSFRDTPQGSEPSYSHEEVRVARAVALVSGHCTGNFDNREAEERLVLALVRQFPR